MSSIHVEFPWEHTAIDHAGPLQTSKQGNNMILVVTDVCTRFTPVRPLKSKMAKDVARTLYHIIADFGVPKIIQSDNGKEFVNSIIHEMKELLGIEHRLISPYHPEANGTAEAAVKSVKSLLQKTIKGNILNWDKYLPTVQMSLNCRIMKRTGSKPFDLLFGRSWLGWQDFRGTQSQPMTVSTLKQHQKDLREIVYPSILTKSKGMAQREGDQFARKHKIQGPLKPKTKVIVKQVDKKRDEANYAGPYSVLRVN
jgi:hypothetical protein